MAEDLYPATWWYSSYIRQNFRYGGDPNVHCYSCGYPKKGADDERAEVQWVFAESPQDATACAGWLKRIWHDKAAPAAWWYSHFGRKLLGSVPGVFVEVSERKYCRIVKALEKRGCVSYSTIGVAVYMAPDCTTLLFSIYDYRTRRERFIARVF
jgi:hypothetical protein